MTAALEGGEWYVSCLLTFSLNYVFLQTNEVDILKHLCTIMLSAVWHHLYCSPNIFGEIKSRIMRWAGHVALGGGEERHIQGFDGET